MRKLFAKWIELRRIAGAAPLLGLGRQVAMNPQSFQLHFDFPVDVDHLAVNDSRTYPPLA